MGTHHLRQTKLIGLALKNPTTNENNQANIDCGNLWQKFETEKYFDRIPGKLDQAILAVYNNYEGDHTAPYSYFIGCRVDPDTVVPEGLDSLTLHDGHYERFVAKGQMPSCIAEAWQGIWNTEIPRAYKTDFEVYDERSRDWDNAEVDIFVSVE